MKNSARRSSLADIKTQTCRQLGRRCANRHRALQSEHYKTHGRSTTPALSRVPLSLSTSLAARGRSSSLGDLSQISAGLASPHFSLSDWMIEAECREARAARSRDSATTQALTTFVLGAELPIGCTRIGNLFGLIDRGEVPGTAKHCVWLGRRRTD
jgi:hypothetical protein